MQKIKLTMILLSISVGLSCISMLMIIKSIDDVEQKINKLNESYEKVNYELNDIFYELNDLKDQLPK